VAPQVGEQRCVTHRLHRAKEQARSTHNRLSRWHDLLAESSERGPREVGLKRLEIRDGDVALEIGGWHRARSARIDSIGGRLRKGLSSLAARA